MWGPLLETCQDFARQNALFMLLQKSEFILKQGLGAKTNLIDWENSSSQGDLEPKSRIKQKCENKHLTHSKTFYTS